MEKKRTRRDRLTILKDLVENLSDRDVKLKRDMSLFEDFFSNFPIPVTIWAISGDGTVMSQRGNGIVAENADCLDNLFCENPIKKICINAHRLALTGTATQEVVCHDEKVYYISIVPRRNEQEEITGTAGISWDITSNHAILENLNDILNISSSKETDDFQTINKLAKSSIDVSRLNTLLDSDKRN